MLTPAHSEVAWGLQGERGEQNEHCARSLGPGCRPAVNHRLQPEFWVFDHEIRMTTSAPALRGGSNERAGDERCHSWMTVLIKPNA